MHARTLNHRFPFDEILNDPELTVSLGVRCRIRFRFFDGRFLLLQRRLKDFLRNDHLVDHRQNFLHSLGGAVEIVRRAFNDWQFAHRFGKIKNGIGEKCMGLLRFPFEQLVAFLRIIVGNGHLLERQLIQATQQVFGPLKFILNQFPQGIAAQRVGGSLPDILDGVTFLVHGGCLGRQQIQRLTIGVSSNGLL